MSFSGHVESDTKLNLVCKGQHAMNLSLALTEQLRIALLESRFVGEWTFFTGALDTRLTGEPGIKIMQRTSIGLRISLTTELQSNKREVIEGILYGPAVFNLVQVHSLLADKVACKSTQPTSNDLTVARGSVIINSLVVAEDRNGRASTDDFGPVTSEAVVPPEVQLSNGKRQTAIAQKLARDVIRYRMMVAEIKKVAPTRGGIPRQLICQAIGRSQGRKSGLGSISSLQALINRGYLTPNTLSADCYQLITKPRAKVEPPLTKKEIENKPKKTEKKKVSKVCRKN